jgi:hypothetical protein
MLIAKFGAIFEVFEIHVAFGDKLEGSCGGSWFARMFFAHALHAVDVAEGGIIAEIAVEAAAVDFCKEVLALFVDHGDRELLVKRWVAGKD